MRQLNQEADKEEKKAFSHWLLEKSEHLDLYIEIKNLWELPISRKLKFNETEAKKRINQAVYKHKKGVRLWQYAQRIAAVFIALLILGTLTYHQSRKIQDEPHKTASVNLISKTSAPGEQLRITLPDGSVVRLNAGSSIQFPKQFDKNFRQVTLSGEAFFEVIKDKERPFEVKSNRITTTVLGTSFNIKAFNKEYITVTVASGKVKVVKNDKNGTDELLLLPNQQATYNEPEKQFRMTEVIARNYSEWTNGTVRFNNDSLNEVAKTLERWYNVRILLKSTGNENIKVNGSYKDKKLYTILDGLSFMYGLDYRYENDTTIIISNKGAQRNSTPRR